jgi:hypothetical protein
VILTLADARDRRVLAAALAHAAATVALAAAAPRLAPPARAAAVGLLALGLVWGSNTIAHIHVHAPLFRSAAANRWLSLHLTLVLGVPQAWWKRRHLRHHALPGEAEPGPGVATEVGLLAALWAALAVAAPRAFLLAYLPAWLAALGLCALQGHAEHARQGAAAGVDYRGRLYNLLWFNDGWHARHHLEPLRHWSELGPAAGRPSGLPPLLRFLEPAAAGAAGLVATALDRLERLPLALPSVRRFMLARHRRALGALLAGVDAAALRRVCIVGGGLFPRTALILRELLPAAELVIVDASASHARVARRELAGGPPAPIRFLVARYDPAAPPPEARADLVIVPLAYRGDRARFYAAPPAAHVIVHDWLWRRAGARSRVVSALLLKRVNLVRAPALPAREFDTLAEESPWSPPALPPPLPPPSTLGRSRAFSAAIARRS